tara:strand:+ start:207 stop:512 length:306 start_codon:yes stop_codon:yes gene_type:complete
MTQRVPNDRKERLEFLRKMHKLRNEVKGENVKIQNRRFEKLYLHVKKLQNNNKLPFIDIPVVKHTKEWGDLVFRIDKENETIRILQRVYKWDSDKDDINDE